MAIPGQFLGTHPTRDFHENRNSRPISRGIPRDGGSARSANPGCSRREGEWGPVLKTAGGCSAGPRLARPLRPPRPPPPAPARPPDLFGLTRAARPARTRTPGESPHRWSPGRRKLALGRVGGTRCGGAVAGKCVSPSFGRASPARRARVGRGEGFTTGSPPTRRQCGAACDAAAAAATNRRGPVPWSACALIAFVAARRDEAALPRPAHARPRRDPLRGGLEASL